MTAVPIDIDTSQAPRFLHYLYSGGFPSVEEQSTLREKLMARGLLTRDTVALMDVRALADVPDDDVLARTVAAALERGGWPIRRAYLIDPARHLRMVQQFQDLAMRTVTTAAFVDEEEALKWLYQR